MIVADIFKLLKQKTALMLAENLSFLQYYRWPYRIIFSSQSQPNKILNLKN